MARAGTRQPLLVPAAGARALGRRRPVPETAAELVQRFPGVEAALRSGKLCLSSVVELAKVLTPENAADVLPRFYGLSSRDAAAVAVSLRPVENAPRRDIVVAMRSAPAVSPEQPLLRSTMSGDRASIEVRAPELAAASSPLPAAPERPGPALGRRPPASTKATTEPLDADTFRVHLTVSRRFVTKVEAVRSALSHSRPGATLEEVLEVSMDLLLAQHAKRKGLVAKPRKAAHPARPGAVPAEVKREVWQRAGGRCEVPVESGGVCGSTLRLEFDHVVPKACGGPATADNIRVACRIHNQHAARRWFGGQWMDHFTRKCRDEGGAKPAEIDTSLGDRHSPSS